MRFLLFSRSDLSFSSLPHQREEKAADVFAINTLPYNHINRGGFSVLLLILLGTAAVLAVLSIWGGAST